MTEQIQIRRRKHIRIEEQPEDLPTIENTLGEAICSQYQTKAGLEDK